MDRFKISAFFALLAAGVLTAVFVAGCNSDTEASQPLEPPAIEAITIRVSIAGMITPKETFSQYSRLLDYIAEKTGYSVELVQTGSYTGVNDRLAREEVDMAFLCSGGYAEAERHLGIKPLVAPVIAGEPLYHSYIVARSDSGFTRFEDFRGRRFAFSDPMSLSGAIYPTYRVNALGYSLDDFFSDFIFTYNHDNSIKALREGLVDGAAVDSIIFNYMKRNSPASVEGLTVLEESPPFGSPPIVTRRRLPPELREQLLDVLVNMEADEKGREILTQLGIDRFVPVDESHYDSVQSLETILNN